MTLTPGCSTTGIVNYFHEDDYLNVYPNPFHTNANIKFLHELINGELIIYDLQGRELEKMKNIYESKIVLSRANLSNGIYFFRLIEGDRISIRKFIVE